MDAADEQYMHRALALAEQAERAGEVPVGALLTRHGSIVGEGANSPIGSLDPAAHAETLALRDAARRLGAYRLPDTTLYVTLEPCMMCLGAVIHARVARLVIGAPDPKSGACGSALDLATHASHNHHPTIIHGVLREDCGQRLRNFFRARRAASQPKPSD